MSKIPYERVVAFLAGPIAILAGWLATVLETHVGVLNTLGISHDKTAAAIVVGATFVVSAAVTFLGHWKWLTNLSNWWQTETMKQISTPPPSAVTAQAFTSNAPSTMTEVKLGGSALAPQATVKAPPPTKAAKAAAKAPPEGKS